MTTEIAEIIASKQIMETNIDFNINLETELGSVVFDEVHYIMTLIEEQFGSKQ